MAASISISVMARGKCQFPRFFPGDKVLEVCAFLCGGIRVPRFSRFACFFFVEGYDVLGFQFEAFAWAHLQSLVCGWGSKRFSWAPYGLRVGIGFTEVQSWPLQLNCGQWRRISENQLSTARSRFPRTKPMQDDFPTCIFGMEKPLCNS